MDYLSANTTKSYYFELQIESSAFENFSKLLEGFPDIIVNDAIANNINITTGNEIYLQYDF